MNFSTTNTRHPEAQQFSSRGTMPHQRRPDTGRSGRSATCCLNSRGRRGWRCGPQRCPCRRGPSNHRCHTHTIANRLVHELLNHLFSPCKKTLVRKNKHVALRPLHAPLWERVLEPKANQSPSSTIKCVCARGKPMAWLQWMAPHVAPSWLHHKGLGRAHAVGGMQVAICEIKNNKQ